MLKQVFFALLGTAIVLLVDLRAPSAQAMVSDLQVYTWGYGGLGNQQQVCKKIAVRPHSFKFKVPERLPAQLQSTIVSDRFCASSAPPIARTR